MSSESRWEWIYHITHVENLPSIIADGALFSDQAMIDRGGGVTGIGMSNIKQRRLGLPVHCHQGLMVGGCVPFYFCPRSVMLYLIYCRNHEELAYRGGQRPIVHLVARLADVVRAAAADGHRVAFSDENAGARYANFCADLRKVRDLKWDAIEATRWSDPAVKGPKQSEFLVEHAVPWTTIAGVGVHSPRVRQKVLEALPEGTPAPMVDVRTDWYY